MSELPPVSLIVVNWNGRAYLEGCLSSLLALNYPAFSVTVVDNASTDGSPELVKERFPQIELILSSDNLGYGGGANLALRKCRADVAVVLNTDIIVPPDWLMQLMAPMLADPQLGIAGCKLYYPGGRSIQHAGGYVTTPQAWPGHYGLNDEDLGQHDVIRDVDYVIGAALAVKRSVWEQIGLFDEGYFLYYEDVDYCQRAQHAGFRVVYIPAASLTHFESATTVKGSFNYLEQFSRGRWRFILKHYDPVQIFSTSLLAEHAWLAHCDPVERQALAAVYRTTIEALPDIRLARMRDGRDQVRQLSDEVQARLVCELETLLVAAHSTPVQPAPEPLPPPEVSHEMNDEAPNPASVLDQLWSKQQIREQPFVSDTPVFGPLIARLRAAWNSVSTKWYVRPLLQQQNEFNELIVAQIAAHDADLRSQATRLAGEAARLTDLEARFGRRADFQEVRLQDHDAWLIAQDREQAQLVRDLAEIRLLLIQIDRLLQDVNGRMHRLEAGDGQKEKERAA